MIHKPTSNTEKNTNSSDFWYWILKKSLFIALLGGSTRYNIHKEGEAYPEKHMTETDKSIPLQSKVITSFDSWEFYQTTDRIRQQTEQWLKNYYHSNDVAVTITDTRRSLKQQHHNYQNKNSRTRFWLHNLGAAADFIISIDWEVMAGTSTSTLVPYQILWYFALKEGLFWWWSGDSWHIGSTETIGEHIRLYPNSVNDVDTREFYLTLVNEQTTIGRTDGRYQWFIEAYEKITWIKTTTHRNYYTNNLGKPRTLLSPIDPYL